MSIFSRLFKNKTTDAQPVESKGREWEKFMTEDDRRDYTYSGFLKWAGAVMFAVATPFMLGGAFLFAIHFIAGAAAYALGSIGQAVTRTEVECDQKGKDPSSIWGVIGLTVNSFKAAFQPLR